MAMSITARLQSVALKKGVTVQAIRTEFLLERLAARLLSSELVSRALTFKGGLVSKLVYGTDRYTTDIDVAAHYGNKGELLKAIEQAVKVDLKDACWYELRDIKPLSSERTEGGQDVSVLAGFGDKPPKLLSATTLHIDISFVPTKYRRREVTESILGFSPLDWTVCLRELTVAEKLYALITIGSQNTMARDVYDLSVMLPSCDKTLLCEVLGATFDRTASSVPYSIEQFLRKLDTTRLQTVWEKATRDLTFEITFREAWQKVLEEARELSLKAPANKLAKSHAPHFDTREAQSEDSSLRRLRLATVGPKRKAR